MANVDQVKKFESDLGNLKTAGVNTVRIMHYDSKMNIIQVAEIRLQDDPTVYPVLTKAGKLSKRYYEICNDRSTSFDIIPIDFQ